MQTKLEENMIAFERDRKRKKKLIIIIKWKKKHPVEDQKAERMKAYMNFVPIEAWSFSKVETNSLGLATASSYFARGGGYDRKLEDGSLTGNGVLVALEVDAIYHTWFSHLINSFPVINSSTINYSNVLVFHSACKRQMNKVRNPKKKKKTHQAAKTFIHAQSKKKIKNAKKLSGGKRQKP